MPTALGFIILAGLAGLLGGAVGAIFARPRLRFLLISLAQAGIFAWMAVESHREAKKWETIMDARRDYPVVTEPNGDHTIVIDEFPGINGLEVDACYPDRSNRPTKETLRSCEWRVDGRGAELFNGVEGVSLVAFESDSWGSGLFKRLAVTYRVNEETKPHLHGLVLRARPYQRRVKAASAFRDLNRGLALILGIGTVVGIAGLASQLLRARRKRESPARP